MLALIGPNWLTISNNAGQRRLDDRDDFVRLEIARALERNIRLIPILFDGASMPSAASLPKPLKPLPRKNGFTVSQHSNERDLDALCDFLGEELKLEKGAAPSPAPTPMPDTQEVRTSIEPPKGEIAQALLDAGVDAKTMISVADMRYEEGKRAIDEEIRRAALPLLEQTEGGESIWVLANSHNLAFSILNQGRAAEAEAMFSDLLLLEENAQGPDHPDTLSTRRGLARALLEQGNFAGAREAIASVPDDDANPMRNGKTALLRAWLADADGEASTADTLLDKAEAFLAHLAPAHYVRRDLARYRETRVPGKPGGTIIWSPDAKKPDER